MGDDLALREWAQEELVRLGDLSFKLSEQVATGKRLNRTKVDSLQAVVLELYAFLKE